MSNAGRENLFGKLCGDEVIDENSGVGETDAVLTVDAALQLLVGRALGPLDRHKSVYLFGGAVIDVSTYTPREATLDLPQRLAEGPVAPRMRVRQISLVVTLQLVTLFFGYMYRDHRLGFGQECSQVDRRPVSVPHTEHQFARLEGAVVQLCVAC